MTESPARNASSIARRALPGKLGAKDRHAEVQRLDALHDAELQDFHDLFDRCAGVEGVVDVASRTRGVHVHLSI